MSSDPVIRLKHLSKKYPVYDGPRQRLLELLTLRRRQFHREFWALHDIDLEVDRKTTLGIIGPNGSGKSTLLQIISGILQPNRGEIEIQGSVAALLELGAGFNPEFTGRENVLMNGVISGLTQQQIEERFDDIVDFSGVGPFIDRPVKTYSSGMFVRLGFAVAIHVDPDILLVDEALSVGDMIFQHRCINRIRRLRNEGKTIVFVTHDLQALTQFCDRAILLDGGRKLADGDVEDVVSKYRALILQREQREAGSGTEWIDVPQDESLPVVKTIPHLHDRFGDGGAEILGIIMHTKEGKVVNQAVAETPVRVLVTVEFQKDVENPIVGLTFRDRMGTELTATNTTYEEKPLPAARKGDVVTVCFEWRIPDWRSASYTISPGVASGNIWEHQILDWIDNAYIFDILESGLVYGLMKRKFEVGYRRFSS